MVKKSVDLKHHNISKSLILKGLAICHYSPLTSTDFSAQNQVKYVKIRQFFTKLSPKTPFKSLYSLDFYVDGLFHSFNRILTPVFTLLSHGQLISVYRFSFLYNTRSKSSCTALISPPLSFKSLQVLSYEIPHQAAPLYQ